jgi:thiamine kinase-like enzyme
MSLPPALQPILARVPAFAAAKNLAVTELSGGITNKNYKVDADGALYVLRLGGDETRHLGIDRKAEYGCTLAAARAGVAPEPVAFLEPEGYLVTRFIPGPGMTAEQIGTETNIRRVVAALHRYHALEHFPGAFSPFRVVEAYAVTARAFDVAAPAPMEALLPHAAEMEAALYRRPFRPGPCHNDLLNLNFIDAGADIRILDWEYAGMGDRFFDLGNFAAQQEFSAAQDDLLLAAYFGAPTRAQRAHFKLMKIMSDLREAMWGVVQTGVATLAFDYAGYAQKYFERFAAGVSQPAYAQWLAEAGA